MAPSDNDVTPRQRLLDAAIELMSREGSNGWTLRRLAEAIGTSHRMVIYHFGSLDGLLLEVVHEVERRHRARRADLASRYTDPVEAARAMWSQFGSPAASAHERLFFELYATGLQGRGATASLPKDSIQEWLGLLTGMFASVTGDAEQAPIDARLGIAVVRGLLLDLLATGDHAAVTAAHERYLALYTAGIEQPKT